ncbi:MAG TPA: hypothetical protein VKU36_00690 [Candidatus Babeliales bacterium]|nr:hypothetical protein [Candidatus Babeliales bacterium]
MKSHILIAVLLMSATSSLMSMEQSKGHLNFIVNYNLKITGYSKQNMEFTMEPSEFIKKRITHVIPLENNKDWYSVKLGFTRASAVGETNQTVKVPYTLGQKNYVAKIIALRTSEQDIYTLKGNFFVKLQEEGKISEDYNNESMPDHFNFWANDKKKCLNFLINNNHCITGYSRQNMDFAVKPAEFIGKNIIDILPLDEKDHNAVALGFKSAVEKEETIKVPYSLDALKFIAKITALKIGDAEYNYFVEVKEPKNKMKALLFVECATGSLMSMSPTLPEMKDCKKLTFLLDPKHDIATYSITTKFKIPINELIGRNLFELSSFKGSQVEDHIKQAFLQPATIRAIVKIENKEFLSKVSPVVVGCGLPYKLLTLKSLEDL